VNIIINLKYFHIIEKSNLKITSFVNSEDQVFVLRIFSSGIQFKYILLSSLEACKPSAVSSWPIRTRSGFNKFSTATPSDRNSGLDNTYNQNTLMGIGTGNYIFLGITHLKFHFWFMIGA